MLTDTNITEMPVMHDEAPNVYEGYVDYFGFDEKKVFYLPDGKQYIEFKPMTEGERAKYESKTSRDVQFNRRTENASLKMNPADDRHALIDASVTDWHIVRKGNRGWEPVPFSKGSPGSTFHQWLNATNPKIVNDLLDAIRKANPWMTEDMTVDMIDEEIKRLEDIRTSVAEREAAGKTS